VDEPEPEAEPEPQEEPEPEEEPESPQGELQTGILDLVGEGYGFLRINGLSRSAQDPYVPRSLVRELGLRRGDEVTGRVVPRRRGERHARMVEIEGPGASTPATNLDDMPAQRPSRLFRAPAGEQAFAARLTELVAPLAHGQRVLVAGGPGAGATHLLQALADALAGTGATVIVALVDVRPEEAPEWGPRPGAEVHAAPTDRAPREQVALAELALERGKRLAERGADVVVVLDSITRLARAYGLARARPGEDAPTPELLAVEGAKRWLAAARETGSGSLTLVAAARVESESPLETLVHEALLDSASAVVRLDSELAARGLHPAIDARRSRTLGEEALLSDAERRPLESLRGVIRSLDPVGGWEYAAARVRESDSNDALLQQGGLSSY
jgi:transcription termination factor Rho